jgi:hypothetical protein
MTNDEYQQLIDFLGRKFEEIDRRFETIDQRFEGMGRRFDAIDRRFDGVEAKLGEHDERFREILDRFDQIYRSPGTGAGRTEAPCGSAAGPNPGAGAASSMLTPLGQTSRRLPMHLLA